MSFTYVFFSYENPFVWQIIIGTVILSIVIGILLNNAISVQEERRTVIKKNIIFFCASCILISTMILVYLTNRPNNYAGKLPVAYLFNPGTNSLMQLNLIDDFEHMIHYSFTQIILRNYLKNTNEPLQQNRIFGNINDKNRDLTFDRTFFEDLTSYLILSYLGFPIKTQKFESLHELERDRNLVVPNESIRGPISYLNDIKKTGKNIFWNYSYIPDYPLMFRLPKNTDINFSVETEKYNTITIANRYLKIKFTISYLVNNSRKKTYLSTSETRFFSDPEKKEYDEAIKYETMLFYTVEFDKLYYSFHDAKYHREWARSVIEMLKLKFKWGAPDFPTNSEIIRYRDMVEQQKE